MKEDSVHLVTPKNKLTPLKINDSEYQRCYLPQQRHPECKFVYENINKNVAGIACND